MLLLVCTGSCYVAFWMIACMLVSPVRHSLANRNGSSKNVVFCQPLMWNMIKSSRLTPDCSLSTRTEKLDLQNESVIWFMESTGMLGSLCSHPNNSFLKIKLMLALRNISKIWFINKLFLKHCNLIYLFDFSLDFFYRNTHILPFLPVQQCITNKIRFSLEPMFEILKMFNCVLLRFNTIFLIWNHKLGNLWADPIQQRPKLLRAHKLHKVFYVSSFWHLLAYIMKSVWISAVTRWCFISDWWLNWFLNHLWKHLS